MSFLMVFAGGFAGYVVTSFFLLRYPNILHKKKTACINASHISRTRLNKSLKIVIIPQNLSKILQKIVPTPPPSPPPSNKS